MKNIDLTNVELLKPLTDIDIEHNNLDLHNDYHCEKISYNEQGKELRFYFLHSNGSDTFVSLIFGNISCNKIEFDLRRVTGNLTLDNFYRGRFEREGKLYEYSEDQKGYFYIEFYEDLAIELFSDNVKLYLQD